MYISLNTIPIATVLYIEHYFQCFGLDYRYNFPVFAPYCFSRYLWQRAVMIVIYSMAASFKSSMEISFSHKAFQFVSCFIAHMTISSSTLGFLFVCVHVHTCTYVHAHLKASFALWQLLGLVSPVFLGRFF